MRLKQVSNPPEDWPSIDSGDLGVAAPIAAELVLMAPVFPVTGAVRLLVQPERCIFCQFRQLRKPIRRFHVATRQLQQASKGEPPKGPLPKPLPSKPTSASTSTLPRSPTADRPHIRARDGELVPKPLARPLGLPRPPQSGENTGVDTRTWKERRDDFASYDKHLERRQGLIKDLYEKNYFRDLGNVGKVHKGKSMLGPATPFRKEVAQYFPNFRGRTLLGTDSDTTDVLRGRTTVVKLISTDWADLQCETFVGKTANEPLWEVLEKETDVAQLVELNVEPNWLKYGLVRMFLGRLKKIKKERQWGKYFLIRRGLDDNIKEALGVWNSKVGYVYLLDAQCKIRWASNGDAREDEKKSLVSCLKRLVDETKGVHKPKISRQDARPTGKVSEVAGRMNSGLVEANLS